jgi:hypothetical protein
MSTTSSSLKQPQTLSFPESSITGSVGDLARLLAHGTEVPEEFYFASGLTVLGSICAMGLRLKIGLNVAPRLYTVLLGESYGVKKSTAQKRTIEVFQSIIEPMVLLDPPDVVYGVGSAEGLMRQLSNHSQLLIAYDELKAFVDKCRVQNSSLLPMVASLFEGENWDNTTKKSNSTQSVRGVHLSLLGCCTTETYASMWTNDAIAIGLPNRLFIVGADRKRRVAWPEAPDQKQLEAISERIKQQIQRLPITLDITTAARQMWEQWYNALPPSEHAKRLDTIGLRLLSLLTLTSDKECVDVDTVQMVRSILDYEFNIRCVTDPIDADNKIARLEEGARRVLGTVGALDKRNLRRRLHADRYGLWAFERALVNLKAAGDIETDGKIFRIAKQRASS